MKGTSNRLFVPLAKEPFSWFQSRQKQWELRKLGRQYTPKHVYIGRIVELRLGYNSGKSLWGEIDAVVIEDSIESIFGKIPYSLIIPAANSIEHATQIANSILNPGQADRYIAFKVGGIISEQKN